LALRVDPQEAVAVGLVTRGDFADALSFVLLLHGLGNLVLDPKMMQAHDDGSYILFFFAIASFAHVALLSGVVKLSRFARTNESAESESDGERRAFGARGVGCFEESIAHLGFLPLVA
jgi:hypothetical protein